MFLVLLFMIPLSMTPFCDGFRLVPNSPAIDTGELTPEHCPTAGFNNSGCIEWFGNAPDIGACEYIPEQAPPEEPIPEQPSNLDIKLSQ